MADTFETYGVTDEELQRIMNTDVDDLTEEEKKIRNKKIRYDNLVPFNKMSKERHREISAKGGRKKAENVRKKADLKKALEMVLSLSVPSEAMQEELKAVGLNVTFTDAIALNLLLNILKDPKVDDVKEVMKMVGQYSEDSKLQLSGGINFNNLDKYKQYLKVDEEDGD